MRFRSRPQAIDHLAVDVVKLGVARDAHLRGLDHLALDVGAAKETFLSAGSIKGVACEKYPFRLVAFVENHVSSLSSLKVLP